MKGTNIHEMFQGGIDRPMYTGFVLVSEFNESAMGVDASSAPSSSSTPGPASTPTGASKDANPVPSGTRTSASSGFAGVP